MEIGVVVFGLFILVCFIFSLISGSKGDPRNHATGRWGVKVGKVARGEFGGEKWGEKPNQK